jgi:predicted transposase/invertase (TIGR01784 family)
MLEGEAALQELIILDPYQAPKIQGMKDTYVDVKAKDGHGRWYIIEMQVLNVEGLEQRILYNACKTYAAQLDSGERYRELTDVIAITITDFIMFPERPGIVSQFQLRAEDGGLYSDDLALVFAELPKFNKTEDQLHSIQDKWFYFLQQARSFDHEPAALATEAPIHHALSIANRAGLSREELDAQEKREIFIGDQRNAHDKALNRGRAEGHEKGRQEGRAEGKHEAALSIARQLLPLLDDAAIAAATGLSQAEVAALR